MRSNVIPTRPLPSQHRLVTLVVRIPPGQRAALERLAAGRVGGKSALVREALDHLIRTQEGTP